MSDRAITHEATTNFATASTVPPAKLLPRAAIYLRVSIEKAKAVDQSVEEQEFEARAVCEQNDWSVAEVYADPNVSASRFAKKDRPDWDRLLADMAAGNWERLVLWESSRGDRKLAEWASMLDQCRDLGVLIHVTNHGRTYNMKNWRDWKVLAEDGLKAAVDSEETSARVLRTKRRMVRDGLPDGRPTLGYRRVYDQATGKLLREEEDPETAPLVRLVFQRLAAGDSVSRISRETGLSRNRIANLGKNWHYIGMREVDGELHRGVWPSLVDEVTFYAVRRILLDPKRVMTNPGRAQHLLSYIATAECGGHLQAVKRTNYVCLTDRCTSVRILWLDRAISQLVVHRISRPDAYGNLMQLGESADREVLEARAEGERLRAQLDEWRLSAARGDTTPATMAVVEEELLRKIAAADERAVSVAVPPQIRGLLGMPEEDVRARWENELSVESRRDVVRTLLRIQVLSAGRRNGRTSRLDLSRVRWEWREL